MKIKLNLNTFVQNQLEVNKCCMHQENLTDKYKMLTSKMSNLT